jgi:hypothetical protein
MSLLLYFVRKEGGQHVIDLSFACTDVVSTVS